MSTTQPGRAHRTQAERSATTRTALIDATITCLIDVGYANTTTRLIADRAGVSQGAQQRHYPTKELLVTAAIHELQRRFFDTPLATADTTGDEHEAARRLLDHMWQLNDSDMFLASVELIVAGRTDPTLSDAVDSLTVALIDHYAEAAHALMPGTSRHPDFRTWLNSAVVSIHGLALRAFTPRLQIDRNWPPLRTMLLGALPEPTTSRVGSEGSGTLRDRVPPRSSSA